MGLVGDKHRLQIRTDYTRAVSAEHESSTEEAVLEEVAMYEDMTQGPFQQMCDMAGRKNTENVWLQSAKKQLDAWHKHITKADDHSTHRHESVGVIRILDAFEEKGHKYKHSYT